MSTKRIGSNIKQSATKAVSLHMDVHTVEADVTFVVDENRSIILVILEQSNVPLPADENVHQDLLQYLTLSLSSRESVWMILNELTCSSIS